MAERRMFAKSIIDSDAFLDMPLSAQALYFHLSMRADDEGFVGNPKRIRVITGASEDDLKLLFVKRFILGFASGVIVIKHWKIHNYIQSDRAKPTTYITERESLAVDENKAYTERLDTQWIQNGYKLDTQDSIGKDRLDIIYNNNAPAHTRENIDDYDRFITDFKIGVDTYSAKIHTMDFTALYAAYKGSKWLRDNYTALSTICDNYEHIIAGRYKDYKKNGGAKTENDREYTEEELNALIKDAGSVEF